MKKILSLMCATTVFITQADVTYIFSNTDSTACNYAMRQESDRIMVLEQPEYIIENEHNGDDQNVADYAASFSKTLEHDATTGVLTPEGQAAYEALLTYMQSGAIADSNAITRAPGATMQLVSPQAAFCRSLIGVPSSIIPIPSAPKLSSSQTAADIIEVYLQALCRDVRFEDYGTGANTDIDAINGGSITNNAAAILTALGDAYKGPRSNQGNVTAAELFRGTSAGDLVGPYISQFLYLPLAHLCQDRVLHNQYVPIAQDREFGVTWNDFISIQNGIIPQPYENNDFNGIRFIINGRDMGTAVHYDIPGEFYLYAASILLTKTLTSPNNAVQRSSTLPYYNGTIINECAFVNMNATDIYTAVTSLAKEALKHAWCHKWRASRRLRPEAIAGLIHQAKINNNNPYNLAPELFAILGGIDWLDWVHEYNQNRHGADSYLLPLLYPEGSPAHPSYPAGHATIAGACATVLKAFFNDTATLIDFGITPVKPNPNNPQELIPLNGEDEDQLTIGGELDKLASNIALGRDFAGVHYRADGDEGILLGEQVALRYLQDYARMYSEEGFAGFELTKRNGERVRVTAYGISVIG